MISTSDIKNGVHIFVDNDPYTVIWFQHHKPGKGGAMLRTKLRHLRSGSIVDRTFKSGEKFKEVEVLRRKKQYLYSDGDSYHFMDMETYDQVPFPKEKLGDSAKFLTENMEVTAIYLEGELVSIELPITVIMKVVSTVPGIKGDSVSNTVKPATLESGIEVNVPLFIKEGDQIKIDTRTGQYVERA